MDHQDNNAYLNQYSAHHREYLDESFYASSVEIEGRALLDPGKAAEVWAGGLSISSWQRNTSWGER